MPEPSGRARDIQRNILLLERARRRADWDAVVRLAEGLVRLALRLHVESEKKSRA